MLPVTFRDPFSRTSQSLHAVVVIPARYESSRLPGKPLADIGGEPMIAHVCRRASETPGVEAVVVATDDDRIAQAVTAAGFLARMTARTHRTGTDRIAEVAADLNCDIVVNLQGDEPLVHPETLQAAIGALDSHPSLQMATVCRRITDEADYLNPNVVKVVRDQQGYALYFSRSPIPYTRGPRPALFKHVGLYAYRRPFLLAYPQMAPTPLEQAESLEQLRALEHGVRIFAALTEHDSIGVDTPEDLAHARRLLAARPDSTLAGTAGAAWVRT